MTGRDRDRPRGREALRARRAAAWGIEPTWDERLSDRLHPVLVRELRQAAGSRLLMLSTGGSLLLLSEARHALPSPHAEWGVDAHRTAARILLVLVIILFGYLPFRAFASIREEFGGDGREQILLSGLRPAGLVLGKLQGAAILAALFLGMSGPVLALCVALRGLSAGLLLTALVGLLAGSLGLTGLGLALGAATHRLRPAAFPILVGAALFTLTGGVLWAQVPQPGPFELLADAVRAGGSRPAAAMLLVGLLAAALGTGVALHILNGADPRRGTELGRWVPLAPLLCLATTGLWPQGPWPMDGAAPMAALSTLPLLTLAVIDRPRPATLLPATLLTAAMIAGGGWIDPAVTGDPAPATAWAGLLLFAVGALAVHRATLARHAPTAVGGIRGEQLLLRAGLTLVAIIGLPMILNGLRAERVFEWNLLQGLSPLAALPRSRTTGFDSGLLGVLGGGALLTWIVALLTALPRSDTEPEPSHPDANRDEASSGHADSSEGGIDGEDPTAPGGRHVIRFAALADRLHPLIVRDVRRAFRTRTYTWTATACCIATVAIALFAVDRQVAGLEVANWTLSTTLRALWPVLLLAIPMQAFQTLHEETDGHSADQLVLAGLRPGAILLGILTTAMLQVAVFLGFFAPLFGFGYLMFSIDLPSLLRILVIAPLASLSCTALALASIRLRRYRLLAGHLATVVLIGLGFVTWQAIDGTDELLRDIRRQATGWSQDLVMILAGQVLVAGLGIAFCVLLAAGSLTPLPEARAVSFRRLGIAAAAAATLLFGGGMTGAMLATLAIAPFWFLAVTEPLALTRRQIPLVPRGSRTVRLRMAPLLPGAARGLLYAMVLTTTCLTAGLLSELVLFGRLPSIDATLRALALASLGLGYAADPCRHRLYAIEPGRTATASARLGLMRHFVLLWIGGVILDSWTVGVSGQLRALVSMINPWFHVSAPELLPDPAIVFGTMVFLTLLLLQPNYAAIRWSLQELQDPGNTPMPAALLKRGPGRRQRRPSSSDRRYRRNSRGRPTID